MISVQILCLFLLTARVAGHARLECPPSLSGETGEKKGPCDVTSDDGSVETFPLKANALNTITWLESIGHPGAPVRFALSGEGAGGSLEEASSGFETCLLLDHIPHDVWSKPNFLDETTYHRSGITLWIPDIKCERCYLQLISIMSDVQHGVPSDTKCTYQGALQAASTNGSNELTTDAPACPVVYHSCAPVSIDGSVPRDDIDVCDTAEFEEKLGWPLKPNDNPDLYERSVYLNRGDVGMYSTTDKTLLSIGSPITDATCTNPTYCDPESSFQEILQVPPAAAYTSRAGSCASVLETKVEPYSSNGIYAVIESIDGTTAQVPEEQQEETQEQTDQQEEQQEEADEELTEVDLEVTEDGQEVADSSSILTLSTANAITAALTVAIVLFA